MNPAEYGMYWTQYTPDRMMLDEHNILSVGMSVMDDITHQTHSMVLNRLIIIVLTNMHIIIGKDLTVITDTTQLSLNAL